MYFVEVTKYEPDSGSIIIYRQRFHRIEMKRFVNGLNESYFVQVDEPEDVKTSSE